MCTPHVSLGMVGSFTVVSSLGAYDAAGDASISVFPNPFVDNLTIKFNPGITNIREITVYDQAGKTLFQSETGDMKSSGQIGLNFSGIPAGLLIFEFRDFSGKTYIRRVIRK